MKDGSVAGRADEFIADTVFRDDDTGCFGAVFQLLTEVLNVNAEKVSGVNISISPDLGEETFMREDTPFVPDEVIEQLSFGRGKFYRFAVDKDFVTVKVNR